MNRQCIPLTTAAADMPALFTEVRMPTRSGRHDLRNEREVRP